MMLNDVECGTFNLFVVQISRNLVVISLNKCFIKDCSLNVFKEVENMILRCLLSRENLNSEFSA